MIPKIIWILWEQGIENAPKICQICIESIIKKNPDWEVRVLDRKKVQQYINVEFINQDFWNIQPVSTRSDIIRCFLLKDYGGVWMDATLYCNEPISNWLFEQMNGEEYFFVKYSEKLKCANWFLASQKNGYIINTIFDNYTSYFYKNLVAREYFQFHSEFKKLNKKDPIFVRCYNNIKSLFLAENVRIHFFREQIKNNNFNKNDIETTLKCPLYKISYKYNLNIHKKFINYLINRDKLSLQFP